MPAIRGSIIYNESAYYAGAKRNILENARKTFFRTYEDGELIVEFISNGRDYGDYGGVSYSDNFVGSLAKAFDTYGKLSEKQVEAVRKIIANRAAKKAEWAAKDAALNVQRRWLGDVGQKIEVELVLKKLIEIERPKFSYYDSGVSYLMILEDAERNVVIYRGTSNAMPFNEGESCRIKATIKECGVREGVKQTVIERPRALAK